MNKLIYIALAAACFSMAGCSNDDAPSIPQTSPDDFESADGQLVIQLGAESSAQATITRSIIKGEDITELNDLGIFALNRNVSTYTQTEANNWQESATKDILLWNVLATGMDRAAYDGDVNGGNKVYLFKPEVNSVSEGSPYAVYYYPMQGNQNYNFYGYFPRQEGTPAIEGGKAVVNFNDLDGSEDIIVGAAPEAPTVFENQLYTSLNESNEPQVGTNTELNGYNSKYIRKIKYHNWLIDTYKTGEKYTNKKPFVPNISFKHKTALLYFQVITAGDQAGGAIPPYDDQEKAKNLRVSDIKVSMQTAAQLDIKTSTVTWQGPETEKEMHKLNTENGTVWDNIYNKIIPQRYSSEGNYTNCGYMLVAPKSGTSDNPESYTITLKVHAPEGANGIPETQDITLTLKAPSGSFEAGKSYNVRIALYALQEVLVEGTLDDWETGDNIDAPIE
ncbi:MAG: hypothetical protein SOW01_08705 [Mediterranea sp.]|nr:hypothetical protein [Mediterranea sp.]